VVTRRLQAERRIGSVRRPKTGVLPTVLHATVNMQNSSTEFQVNVWRLKFMRHIGVARGCNVGAPAPPRAEKKNSGVFYRKIYRVSAPQHIKCTPKPSKSQFLRIFFGDLEVGVVDLVVLERLLRATSKKNYDETLIIIEMHMHFKLVLLHSVSCSLQQDKDQCYFTLGSTNSISGSIWFGVPTKTAVSVRFGSVFSYFSE